MATRHDPDCSLCTHADLHGWWGVSGITHCMQCGRSWSGLSEAHCSKCHRHFSTDRNAEKHSGVASVCLSDRSIGRRGLRKVETKFGVLWKGLPREGSFG